MRERGSWSGRRSGSGRHSRSDASLLPRGPATEREARASALAAPRLAKPERKSASKGPSSETATGGETKIALQKDSVKRKKALPHVSWADEKGEPLCSFCLVKDHSVSSGSVTEPRHPPWFGRGKLRLGTPLVQWKKKSPRGGPAPPSSRPTYKEALLRLSSVTPPASSPSPSNVSASLMRPVPPPLSTAGRCFRCLARDQRVRDCRDPLRCLVCRKVGHSAPFCRQRRARAGRLTHSAPGCRPPSQKFFVPLNEGFRSRQEARRNAVLADVIAPVRLGLCPQVEIAGDLAAIFGGFRKIFSSPLTVRGIT